MSDSDRIRGRSSTHRAIAAVLMGGALVCAGSALPWMSFFAGLQSLSGLVGLYGRILLASGALAVLAGAAMLRRNDTWLPLATAALGLLQTIFILWLLIGVRDTVRGLGMHAMLLPRPGPGLFVCLGGALLIMLVPWRVMNGGWRGASRSE